MTVAPSFEYERNKIIRILAQKAPERLVQMLKKVTPLKELLLSPYPPRKIKSQQLLALNYLIT